MGEVVPFAKKRRMVTFQRMTKLEFDAALKVLIEKGLSTFFSIHHDGQYLCVFDRHGDPYFIGREESEYYLFGPDETLLAQGLSVEEALYALELALKSPPNLPA